MTNGRIGFEMRAIAQALVLGALVMGAVACSSSDDDKTNAGSSGNTNTGDAGDEEDAGVTVGASLSKAFNTNCVRCHGAKGLGNGADIPEIPGDLTEDEFIATVRAGKGGAAKMPAFTASQISDADLTNDYTWLTTKR